MLNIISSGLLISLQPGLLQHIPHNPQRFQPPAAFRKQGAVLFLFLLIAQPVSQPDTVFRDICGRRECILAGHIILKKREIMFPAFPAQFLRLPYHSQLFKLAYSFFRQLSFLIFHTDFIQPNPKPDTFRRLKGLRNPDRTINAQIPLQLPIHQVPAEFLYVPHHSDGFQQFDTLLCKPGIGTLLIIRALRADPSAQPFPIADIVSGNQKVSVLMKILFCQMIKLHPVPFTFAFASHSPAYTSFRFRSWLPQAALQIPESNNGIPLFLQRSLTAP